MVRTPDDENIALGETVAPPASSPGATLPTGDAATVASSGGATAPHARAAADDLAAGTTIGDRYLIASALGRGGMGTVYLARDVTLARDIAVKLHRHALHDDRLYREAVAMAQLAHPNVVTVFEVGRFEDRLFVAMEYVRGATLRDWLAAVQRDWREIVAMLVDVGEGLAAAHRAGLVHRDFKPENVLVGEDGRPRVGDFGLARADETKLAAAGETKLAAAGETQSAPPAITASGGRARATPLPVSGAMTVTGALLGTPAYMPPEQYSGDDVDPRGDQFSFCVAAWECLYGNRPFEGATLAALQQAIERRRIVEPPAGPVPPAIRRALTRGLAPTPAERWPDMASLLAALRAVARRRARWPAVAAAGAVVAIGAVVAVAAWPRAASHAAASNCAAAGAEIDELVPRALRAEVIARAAQAGAGTGTHAEQNLAHVVASFRTSAQAACRATERSDWSRDVAERSDACREQQALTVAALLQATLDRFHEPRRPLVMSAEVLAYADLGACNDPQALVATPLWPSVQRTAIAHARAELQAASFLVGASAVDPANAIVARIAAGSLATTPGVASALAMVRADQLDAAGDSAGAIRAMGDAYYQARASGDQRTEIAALEKLLLWVGSEREDSAGVETWYRLALSELPRYQRTSPLGAAQLRSALVGVATARNELSVAVEQGRLAAEALADGPPLARASALHEYANALATAGQTAQSIPVYEQSAKQIEDAFGPDDLNVAEILGDLCLTLADAGRDDEAIAAGERAVAIARKHEDSELLPEIELNLAAALSDSNQNDRAEELLIDARARSVKLFGADSTTIATIDTNLARIALERGRYTDAVPRLRTALAIEEKAVGPDHPDVAGVLMTLSSALDQAKDFGGAIAAARRSVAIRAKTQPRTDFHALALAELAEVENDAGRPADALRDAQAATDLGAPHTNSEAVAWPALERARALLALHEQPDVAAQLLAGARTTYEKRRDDARVAEIAKLLATPTSGRAPHRP